MHLVPQDGYNGIDLVNRTNSARWAVDATAAHCKALAQHSDESASVVQQGRHVRNDNGGQNKQERAHHSEHMFRHPVLVGPLRFALYKPLFSHVPGIVCVSLECQD